MDITCSRFELNKLLLSLSTGKKSERGGYDENNNIKLLHNDF